MDKLLILHLNHEIRACKKISFDRLAHRLHMGASGKSVVQHINKMRNKMAAKGHIVPPKASRGESADKEVRGYARPLEGDPKKLRKVYYSERFYAPTSSGKSSPGEEAAEEEEEDDGDDEEDEDYGEGDEADSAVQSTTVSTSGPMPPPGFRRTWIEVSDPRENRLEMQKLTDFHKRRLQPSDSATTARQQQQAPQEAVPTPTPTCTSGSSLVDPQ